MAREQMMSFDLDIRFLKRCQSSKWKLWQTIRGVRWRSGKGSPLQDVRKVSRVAKI